MVRKALLAFYLLVLVPTTLLAQATVARPTERTVLLAQGMSGDDLVVFTANVAASGRGCVPLFDSPRTAPSTADFRNAFRPDAVVPVGPFRDRPPEALWELLFDRAERVVVCPAEPRPLLLQAATLAGISGAPLLVARGQDDEPAILRRWLERWKTTEVLAVGEAKGLTRGLENLRVTPLTDAAAVADATERALRKKGPITALVVANPADARGGRGAMSRLAPWIAAQKRAPLLLTNPTGDNVAPLVREAMKRPALRDADALILVANPEAIPVEKRPNPVEGKDTVIEMEPLTPTDAEPFTFATGRLFHDDPNVVALMLARQRLLTQARGPRRALVASNPGGGLPLLETFSRHTARELRSRGYQTTALFESEMNREIVRRLLPEQDIFLWEGHHKTMVEEYELPKWTEPLRPSLVVLQSCLALNEDEAYPLLQRGAVAVVGSSTRTYSGSGGAFTLAYFDALLYEDRSLGQALRQAKNFLLAYSLLKEKRLGDGAKLRGANLRSAWAFSLWGDPTLRLPRPEAPADALTPVRHEVTGRTIVVKVPEKSYEPVKSEKFQAQMWPNGRLAGLLTRDETNEEERHLVPLVFAEVSLPKAPTDREPRLSSRLPSRSYVFLWDARRKTGYLLVRPTSREARELRFTVHWDSSK